MKIDKWNKKMTIINYKKWAANIILVRRRKKSSLETHIHFVVDTSSLLGKIHWNILKPYQKAA